MSKSKVRVAIIGVGNCASSLVQGVHFYKDAKEDDQIPGLMHVNLGGYHIRDIEFTAAFDVVDTKVGKDLSEAIFAYPNNTYKFTRCAPPERACSARHDPRRPGQVPVPDPQESPRSHGGYRRHPEGAPRPMWWSTSCRLAPRWRPSGTWSRCWKPAAPSSTPSRCSSPAQDYWAKRFHEHGLPIIGDDIKSQVGATILHRVLTSLFVDRGVRLDRTYQLNFGGNTDFLNMLERERLESKKISKTGAVTSMLPYTLPPDDVHVGPSDYVPWLTDRKWCYVRMEGTTFGDVPLNLEAKLEVWDSPNSAGVMIDAVRCAKLALDRGISGPLIGPSSYFMKTPPKQFKDEIARQMAEAFIRGEE